MTSKNIEKHVSYFQLYRYATWSERLLLIFSCIMAWGSGFVLFWLIVQFGEITSLLVDRTTRIGTSTPTIIIQGFGGGKTLTNASIEENRLALHEDLQAHGLAAMAQFLIATFTAYISATIMNWTAIKQTTRMRMLFFKSALRQNMAFFDTDSNLNVATTMNDNIDKIQDGISQKVSLFLFLMSNGVIGTVVSFAFGWQLALACVTVLPFAVGSAVWVSDYQSKSAVQEQESYSHAGRLAEETIAGIRTVVAFAGEDKETERFARYLEPAESSGLRRAYVTGAGTGVNWLLTFSLNCIGFLYGVRLVYKDMQKPMEERVYFSGTILTIMFNMFLAVQNIAMSSTQTECFSAARGAAKDVFKLIEQKSNIDGMDEEGKKPNQLIGEIKLDDVHFSYPSRSSVQVLKGISLHIKAGETVALVGSSGCGKSTILQMVQRMYDPKSGRVSIDGNNVKDLNLNWLRTRLGVVGQEPILFSGSIRENIAIGKPDATFEEIKKAAMIANAHDFIAKLVNQYDTIIGERGSSLSGGQKQRIAIARSMIRDPPLLLLDEPTSALDSASERRVQAALDKASKGRTTLVVSHRLSTIVNASRIICMDQGTILEEGTHEELLKNKGAYWRLTNADGDAKDDTVMEEEEDEEGAVNKVALYIDSKQTRKDSVKRDSVRQNSVRRRSSFKSEPNSPMAGVMQPRFSLMSKSSFLATDYEEDEENEEVDNPVSFCEIMKLCAPEWPLLLIGTIASVVQGATWPVFNFLFPRIMQLFTVPFTEESLRTSDLLAGSFMIVAVASGIGMFLQGAYFTKAGLKLTTRLRIQAYRSYLKSEMEFFDSPKNAVGMICARLSGDAAAVQGGTGTCIGMALQSLVILIIGVVIALIYNWKLGLVGMLFIPIVAGIQWYDTQVMFDSEAKLKRAMESATKVATEAMIAIKTVQSLGIEEMVLNKYEKTLKDAQEESLKALRLRGLVYALGQALPCAAYNYCLLYGGILMADENLPYTTALTVVQNTMLAAFILGQALVFVPNFRAAATSAARILKVIKREPFIQSLKGVKDDQTWAASGAFSFNNLEFAYSSRPKQKILKNLSLHVQAGKTVALVGHSGCGKSTCLQLMQRFYDPTSGSIKLDSRDIKQAISLPQLRRQLGVVSQEPTLFERTIAENIAYGDNTRKVAMDEIVNAAKAANIHSFIVSLPKGYDTVLGSGGAQLSGGQKQRVCIARALVRAPRLLLLDEATSALDAQSQKVVADALDNAAAGRTCVTIAHRLSTIQNADLICVLDKGEIVEQGTHNELVAMNGHYRKMLQMQSTNTT